MININEITEYSNAQLPDTLEDLTQFVLVGKAKLQAYMLKLQTVNKLSVAQEIRDQTLKETQEVSNALIAAEQRIGELLLAIPKATPNNNPFHENRHESNLVKSKSETIREMGYTKDEASDYQQMAKNPEIVQKVIEEAIANGEVVTKASVMREIKFYKDRISNLEKNSESKVVTKEVMIEVIPEDIKRKAAMSDAHKKDFETMRDAYEEMAEKYKQSEAEKQKLIEESKKPEVEQAENLKRSALFFCAGVSNFIEKYGGYVWLTQHINEMEKSERKGYLAAINAVESWVTAIKQNMEGIE